MRCPNNDTLPEQVATPLPRSVATHYDMPMDRQVTSAANSNTATLGILLEMAAGGDEGAFESLYNAASGKIFSVCLHLLPRRDLAEEVVQEAFVRIWQSAGSYNTDRGTPMTWMISIARNAAIDRLRKARRDPTDKMRSETPPEQAQTISLVDTTAQREDGQAITKCLKILELGQRDAILLAYYYGYSHGELAEKLDIPLGTAKSWIRRGLSKLKQCLES